MTCRLSCAQRPNWVEPANALKELLPFAGIVLYFLADFHDRDQGRRDHFAVFPVVQLVGFDGRRDVVNQRLGNGVVARLDAELNQLQRSLKAAPLPDRCRAISARMMSKPFLGFPAFTASWASTYASEAFPSHQGAAL